MSCCVCVCVCQLFSYFSCEFFTSFDAYVSGMCAASVCVYACMYSFTSYHRILLCNNDPTLNKTSNNNIERKTTITIQMHTTLPTRRYVNVYYEPAGQIALVKIESDSHMENHNSLQWRNEPFSAIHLPDHFSVYLQECIRLHCSFVCLHIGTCFIRTLPKKEKINGLSFELFFPLIHL